MCLSEPGQPHAWPALYQHPANQNFVGCSNFDTTIVALTTDGAYLANGATPESVSLEDMQIDQGCISQRSIVSLGKAGVVYASPDGLIGISRNGWNLLTGMYFKRDEWQSLNPSSIHAYLLDGQYVAFYDTGSEQGGFIFDPSAGNGLVFIDAYASAGFTDKLNDALYLQIGDYIERWDHDSLDKLTYTYRSKRFDPVAKYSLTCAEVHAESYDSLIFRLYADDVLVHTQTVASREPFRITAYNMSRIHEVELEGTDNVKRVAVAESFEELA